MYSDCKLFQSSEDTGSTEAQQNATPTESALAWIGRGSATYDDANQIATWAGTSFTYDDNGNLTSDGSKSYSWNARNELTGIGGGGSASFAYDAAGRRRSRTVGSTTTQFLYDGLNPVQELASGTPTANLLTGLGIDEYFTRTDAVGVRNLLTDALGSTIALADASGSVQTEYTYEPYGSVTVSGASSGNTFGFTGRENDGTGLNYYRARYYSSGTTRFLSEDPALYSQGDLNLYRYVWNDPILFVDPSGLGICETLRKNGRAWSLYLWLGCKAILGDPEELPKPIPGPEPNPRPPISDGPKPGAGGRSGSGGGRPGGGSGATVVVTVNPCLLSPCYPWLAGRGGGCS